MAQSDSLKPTGGEESAAPGPAWEPPHDDHGRTPANWTVSILVTLAFLVGTIGVILGVPAVFWVGVALIPIALVIGKAMSGMGYGAGSGSGH